jgi:CelD/BcsL family acetyltransferase involved in cellulose biosynthesis
MGERNDRRVVVRTDLGPLAGAWDALVERLALPSPFLRSWWLQHTAGPDPRFVLVMEGGTLLGGLALQEDRVLGVPRLRVLGAGPLCPDHLDAVLLPGRERDALAALAGWLGRPGSRLIDFDGVAQGARVAEALPGRVRREVVDHAPWMALPDEPDAWRGGISRNLRSNLRKTTNRLGREAAAPEVVQPATADAGLTTLRRLHHERWGGRSRFLAGFDAFAAAARAGVARREFAFHELTVGGKTVATMSSFEVAGRLSMYQAGRLTDRAWRGAAPLLLARVIEDACGRGLTEMDFLRGDEEYKHNFAPEAREVLRLRAATGAAGRTALATLVLAGRLRRLAGGALRRVRSSRVA